MSWTVARQHVRGRRGDRGVVVRASAGGRPAVPRLHRHSWQHGHRIWRAGSFPSGASRPAALAGWHSRWADEREHCRERADRLRDVLVRRRWAARSW